MLIYLIYVSVILIKEINQMSCHISLGGGLVISYHFNFEHIAGTPSPGSHVKPGEKFIYEWEVPETVGPTADDPDCLTMLYYSASDPIRDTNSGLVGPLLVCRKGIMPASWKPVMKKN